MAFQPVPNTARLAVIHNYFNQLLVNVFHVYIPGNWATIALEDNTLALATAWVNDVMIHLNSNLQFLRVEARGMRAQNDVFYTYVAPTFVSGGRNQEPMPGNVAFCVTHLTGLTGRANRGRTYFGGLDRADVSGNTITQARADGLVAGLQSIRNELNNIGSTLVVVNRRLNNVVLPVANTIPVTGFRYADRTVDSQRRRLPGRGA